MKNRETEELNTKTKNNISLTKNERFRLGWVRFLSYYMICVCVVWSWLRVSWHLIRSYSLFYIGSVRESNSKYPTDSILCERVLELDRVLEREWRNRSVFLVFMQWNFIWIFEYKWFTYSVHITLSFFTDLITYSMCCFSGF